jgi:hypothetical protein
LSEGKKESAAEVSDRKKITGSTKIGVRKNTKDRPFDETTRDGSVTFLKMSFKWNDGDGPAVLWNERNRPQRSGSRKWLPVLLSSAGINTVI